MDQANAIIVHILFGVWIRKTRRTSLKVFGTIRKKIQHCHFLLHRLMFHNDNLAGKQRSSPESCCLQGIRFSGLKAFRDSCNRNLVLYEVKLNPPPPVSASGASTPPLPTSPQHLPNQRTWKSNSLRHPRGIPTQGRLESIPANPPRLAFRAQNFIFPEANFSNSCWESV